MIQFLFETIPKILRVKIKKFETKPILSLGASAHLNFLLVLYVYHYFMTHHNTFSYIEKEKKGKFQNLEKYN